MLGILPGLVGVIQATEVIKLILGKGEPLIGRLLLVDALGMKFRELKLRKNPDCPVCGTHPHHHQADRLQRVLRHSRRGEAGGRTQVPEIQVEELKRRLDAGEDLFVLDVREPHEYQICNIGGHLIPLGDLPKRVQRTGFQPRDRGPLPLRRAQRQGGGLPAPGRLHKVHNLAGGILAWADRVDPKMPKY